MILFFIGLVICSVSLGYISEPSKGFFFLGTGIISYSIVIGIIKYIDSKE